MSKDELDPAGAAMNKLSKVVTTRFCRSNRMAVKRDGRQRPGRTRSELDNCFGGESETWVGFQNAR